MYRGQQSSLIGEASPSLPHGHEELTYIEFAERSMTQATQTAHTFNFDHIGAWLHNWLNSFVTRHCMAVLPDPFSIFPKGVWARD